MSRQWGPGPIFCSENSLALNSEGLEVPKDTERRGDKKCTQGHEAGEWLGREA